MSTPRLSCNTDLDHDALFGAMPPREGETAVRLLAGAKALAAPADETQIRATTAKIRFIVTISG
jgi:hypothetical protein